MKDNHKFYSTTVVCVKRGGVTAIAGDGQVTLGNTIVKGNACKVRGIYNDKIVTGLAGAVADAFTLYDRFEKKLEVNGVGFRVAVQDNKLVLNLGFSHPIEIKTPEGISFEVEKNIITVSGIDKQMVGQVAANIREQKKPEPYKGKGIRYIDEIIRRKAGKKAVGTE